jgi:cation diffusion facilitator family transporter
MTTANNENEKCTGCGLWTLWITTAGNIIMALIKGFTGVLTGSWALLADALHSGADIICSSFAILSTWMSRKKSDQKHPYGYGKVEFFVGIIVGAVLIFAGANIFIPSIRVLFFQPKMPIHAPSMMAFWVALISIYANVLVSKITFCAAKHINSPALDAVAADNRSDAYSSIAVALAILGAQLGIPQLDPIGAVFVSIIIFKIALDLIIKNYKGLMDAAIHPEQVKNISKLVKSLPEIKDIGYIKTRLTGRNIWVDIQVLVNGKKTVLEADSIVAKIRLVLREKIKAIGNVQVTLKPV